MISERNQYLTRVYMEYGIDWICKKCKKMNVNQSSWTNVNHPHELVDFVDDSSYWCENCNEETTLIKYEEKKHGSIQEVVNRTYG